MIFSVTEIQISTTIQRDKTSDSGNIWNVILKIPIDKANYTDQNNTNNTGQHIKHRILKENVNGADQSIKPESQYAKQIITDYNVICQVSFIEIVDHHCINFLFVTSNQNPKTYDTGQYIKSESRWITQMIPDNTSN